MGGLANGFDSMYYPVTHCNIVRASKNLKMIQSSRNAPGAFPFVLVTSQGLLFAILGAFKIGHEELYAHSKKNHFRRLRGLYMSASR